MKIYFVKVALRGVSPMVWRRLRVPGQTSLARLHHCLQVVNGWDDFHLHQFHIYGKDYGISYAGGVAFSDNPHRVYLDDFEFDVGDKFTYEYNFFEENLVDIRVEKIKDVLSIKTDVVCLSGSGMPNATKQDMTKVQFNFIKKIVKLKGKLTVGDVIDYQEAMNQVRFNRNRINNLITSIVQDNL